MFDLFFTVSINNRINDSVHPKVQKQLRIHFLWFGGKSYSIYVTLRLTLLWNSNWFELEELTYITICWTFPEVLNNPTKNLTSKSAWCFFLQSNRYFFVDAGQRGTEVRNIFIEIKRTKWSALAQRSRRKSACAWEIISLILEWLAHRLQVVSTSASTDSAQQPSCSVSETAGIALLFCFLESQVCTLSVRVVLSQLSCYFSSNNRYVIERTVMHSKVFLICTRV